ncbi:N-acetylmuramoyl-L-alanine amidase [Bacteroides eggerthii]|mgnify:FL=1|jgi:N-acetylmuramoyl-L-alanine amidase|uniref:N-acetylmuramoyl-L-alanine amidase n=1 Tax=Bacteroides eggerthii TaxID=28111 RepID=A0ABT7U8J9_9BACE|nr:N-acetylmuramoyl-L-alanine amidase [Bacteroides eggerthii]
MKQVLYLYGIVWALIVPLFALPLPTQARERFKIVIDAGHGGKDQGAAGRKIQEKEVTLKIAKRAEKYIRRRTRGVDVILTRERDEFISLNERANFANFCEADLFISIHANSARGYAEGTETFVWSKRHNPWSLKLARLIQKEYTERAKRKNRGVKKANFAVLRNTNMPAVLTEVGFISNAKEEKYMKSRRGRRKLAYCIYQAVKQYLNSLDE